MSNTTPLSTELVGIKDLLTNCTQPDGTLKIDPDRTTSFVRRIMVLSGLARSMEDELAVHRVQQSKTSDAALLEDIAGEYLVSAADDTVVSVNFKVKKGGAA